MLVFSASCEHFPPLTLVCSKRACISLLCNIRNSIEFDFDKGLETHDFNVMANTTNGKINCFFMVSRCSSVKKINFVYIIKHDRNYQVCFACKYYFEIPIFWTQLRVFGISCGVHLLMSFYFSRSFKNQGIRALVRSYLNSSNKILIAHLVVFVIITVHNRQTDKYWKNNIRITLYTFSENNKWYSGKHVN